MKRVETSIRIDASASQVWSILTDFSRHPEWNPFITNISGRLREGGKLSVTIRNASNCAGFTFKPKLLAAVTDRELRWRGKLLLPRLFDGEHFFLLQRDGTGTWLVHGETFSGLLADLLPAEKLDAIEAGFVAMNQALKRRCEEAPKASSSCLGTGPKLA